MCVRSPLVNELFGRITPGARAAEGAGPAHGAAVATADNSLGDLKSRPSALRFGNVPGSRHFHFGDANQSLIMAVATHLSFLCLAVALAGCGNHISRTDVGQSIPYSGQDLKTLMDRRIRAVGTADNAKLGGVIVVGDMPLYLEGVESWPPDLVGTQLMVIGTVDSSPLRRRER